MQQSTRVAVLIGSLRAESFSRKIANTLIERAPRSLHCEIVEIGDLPLYNQDLDQGAPPAAWARLREQIKTADAVLFVTPEYNRSIPGCLKNAIDVGSRPAGKNVFDGLPAGVVSVTPYKLGAFGANHALRQTFVFLNMPVMQQPEAYIGNVGDLLGDDGKPKGADTTNFLDRFIHSFERWVTTIRGAGNAPDFDAFMRKREQIARDYVSGDPTSLSAIVTQTEPATFLSPGGDHQQGAADIAARYAKDANTFHPGGTTQLEILQSAASGELAFWTGLQHAKVRMGKNDDAVPMTLRVTEVFRLEGGEYKLMHRHADPAAKPKRG